MKAGPGGEISGIQVVLEPKENNADTVPLLVSVLFSIEQIIGDTTTVNNDDFVSNDALKGNECYSK